MGATYALGSASYGFEWFSRNIGTRQTMFDIGANRGQMALYCSRLVGQAGRVVAFEPVPDVYADLVRNVSTSGCKNIEPVNSAVSRRNGTATFAFAAEHSTQGKLAECEETYKVTGSNELDVATVTLDSFICATGRVPDFLKIDVEGGATLVVEGAAEVLSHWAPAIYMELHGPDEQSAAATLMNDFGYHLRALDDSPVADPVTRWVSPLVALKRDSNGSPPRTADGL